MRPGVAVVDRRRERGRRGLQSLCQFGFDEPRDAPGRRAEHGVGQLGGGHAGHPVRQFVGLVDDEQLVFGQHRGVGDGVDGQQRVVGDDDVGVPRLVARLLREAVGAERAARRADALPAETLTCAHDRSGTPGVQLVAVAGRRCSTTRRSAAARPGPSAVDAAGVEQFLLRAIAPAAEPL